MTARELTPDCARCAGLCCAAPAFVRSEDFPIDKPAATACPNLDVDFRCRIYATRAAHGFAGCLVYDCYGAGQRVTQDLFDGRSWREEPALLAEMTQAFLAARRLHELLALLAAARRAKLSPAELSTLCALEDELDPPAGVTRARLASFDAEKAGARVRAFLATLRHHFVKP